MLSEQKEKMEQQLTKILNKQIPLRHLLGQTIEERREFCNWLQSKIRNILKRSEPDLLILHPISMCNSDVCLAYDNTYNTLMVVKKIMHKEGSYIIPINTIYELTTFMKIGISTQNLCSLKNIRISERCTDIITEFYPLSFNQLFHGRFTPLEFIEIKVKELIYAVKTLHSLNIAHRDIKSSNICFRANSSLILLDFDSSSSSRERGTLPICTLNNRAPELIKMQYLHEESKTYDAFACDWWSVGCVIAEMFLGESLFKVTNETNPIDLLFEIQEFLKDLHIRDICKFKKRMSKDLYLLVKNLLQENPNKRIYL